MLIEGESELLLELPPLQQEEPQLPIKAFLQSCYYYSKSKIRLTILKEPMLIKESCNSGKLKFFYYLGKLP